MEAGWSVEVAAGAHERSDAPVEPLRHRGCRDVRRQADGPAELAEQMIVTGIAVGVRRRLEVQAGTGWRVPQPAVRDRECRGCGKLEEQDEQRAEPARLPARRRTGTAHAITGEQRRGAIDKGCGKSDEVSSRARVAFEAQFAVPVGAEASSRANARQAGTWSASPSAAM